MPGKYVDFSNLEPEVAKAQSEALQKVAFSLGFAWNESDKNLFDSTVIHYDHTHKHNPLKIWCDLDGDLVSFSEFVAYLLENSPLLKKSDPEPWWKKHIGKRVLVWDNQKFAGTISDILSDRSNGLFVLRSYLWNHIAAIEGHEYRLHVPYDQWPEHEEEA